MDQMGAAPIRGTDGSPSTHGRSPFFSPDGESIGFWADGQLKRVPVDGGVPVALTDAMNPFGATWTTDQTILYGQGQEGIWRVSATGGVPEQIISVEGGQAHGPQLLPDDDHVLFTLNTSPGGTWNAAQIVVESLTTGRRHVVVDGAQDARYVPTGHLLYVDGGILLAAPFDTEALEVVGGPVALVEDIRASGVTGGGTGAAQFSVSPSGTLAYVPGLTDGTEGNLTWVDRAGTEIGALNAEPLTLPRFPRLSPDGQRLAIVTGPLDAGRVWVYDVAGRPPIPVTFERSAYSPFWMPDGRGLIVEFGTTEADALGLFSIASDGTGQERFDLFRTEGHRHPLAWTDDGATLIFAELRVDTGWDLLAMSLENENQARAILESEVSDGFNGAAVSPDGRWLAYTSVLTGRSEIYVRPYHEPGAPARVSPGGGIDPAWSQDGRELFYLEGNRMMAVGVEADTEFRFEAPVALFERLSSRGNQPPYYAADPTGMRFLMITPVEGSRPAPAPQINVVLDWFQELTERVPVP